MKIVWVPRHRWDHALERNYPSQDAAQIVMDIWISNTSEARQPVEC